MILLVAVEQVMVSIKGHNAVLRSELLVPSMNVPADPAQPMLLVFPASCRSAQQILKIVSVLLVYSVRWTIRFWDCTGLPPRSMQKVLSEEVTTAQNALLPIFEGETQWDPGDPGCSKGPRPRLEETAKQAKKIDKQVMKQEAKQEAKQAAKAASTLKAAGKRTSASSQLSRLESSLPGQEPSARHDRASCCWYSKE